ncbi:hypothetical protein PLESTB_000453800 [Pleodorina starrii]|uniref:Uncharacterized protein n=1 Tax=Pleodorina starrii TaxID=330485 RepID=A0A9W6BF29_9CHLO|nr:hypothetical protein PLESTM_000755200 [Pleodorina starrii]GLC50987.1 hypothetical protein PLESTB_000453800 [Pleodorina starrii]
MTSSLSTRDARRVVQVLVPGVPPPVMDFVFASITKANSGSIGTSSDYPDAPPPARYALRGCDGGPLWGLSLLESAASADGPLPCKQSHYGALQFHYAPPAAPTTTTPPRRR